MYNPYEDFGELLDDTESDESFVAFESDEADFESDERARRAGRGRPAPRRVPTAGRGNTVPRPNPQGFATKAELQQTAARIDAKIAVNSKAVQTLDGRVRAVVAENGRIGAALAKEIRERKTVTEALRKSIDEQRQIAMLLPLLSTYEKRSVGGVDNVLIDSGDKLSSLLPILLMSGGFGGSGASGGGLMGGDNSMATMAMVIALADR
jgi:hypothetical protein